MKKSIINSLFWLFITIFAFTIAIPTLILNINNSIYRIRGWDPIDSNPNSIYPNFQFLSSIDIHGGNITTINVDLSSIDENNKENELNNIKNILYLRLLKTNIGQFELNSVINKDKNEYNLVLKLPEQIDSSLLSLITTPAIINFWVEDSEKVAVVDEQTASQDLLSTRKPSSLDNEDIQDVRVVSDSKCYVSDPSQPRNFCLKITFKEESKSEFIEALYTSTSGRYPLLMLIDNTPIAIQSLGQFYSGVTPDKELIVYPRIPDTWSANAVLAAVISDRPINYQLVVLTSNTLHPLIGEAAEANIKISLLALPLVLFSLIVYYFRKRSNIAIISILLFLIFSVALMKVFNVVMDFPMIMGYILSFLIYLFFLVYLLYKLRTASKAGLYKEEIEEVYMNVKNSYRNLSIFIIISVFAISTFSPLFTISFFNSLGFGVVVGLTTFIFPFKTLLSLLLLPKEKWHLF